MGEELVLEKGERYHLDSPGKSAAYKLLRAPGSATLRPQPDLSVNFDTAEHVFIEGENLEVLKVRQDAAHQHKAEALLAEFFLETVAQQPASEISYGQQKLLTLACCSAVDASLLLLDEPVAGISPEYRELLAARLAGFKAAGKTILLIKHQPDFLS